MTLSRQKATHVYFSIGFFVVAVMAYAAWSGQQEKPNPENNCFKHISGKMAILIDKTDIIPIQTQTEIQNRAWDAIQEHSKMGDLISVYEITQNSLQNLKPSFQMCRPKSGDDASELTENVKNIDKKFKEQFEKPLLNILSGNTGQAQNSPIAEAINDINLSKNLRDAEYGRILLFSDLMQHSSNVSTYGCKSPDDAISHFKQSRQGSSQRPTFNNTIVELHIIPRPKMSETEVACRDKFWLWFFGDMRGEPEKVRLIRNDLPGSYGAIISTKNQDDSNE
jgi:hypothetical protein